MANKKYQNTSCSLLASRLSQVTPAIIQLINRFVHGVSYFQIEENSRAICLQKFAAASAESVTLPESIQPYVFTTLVYDNIDFIRETLTGEVTIHQVNEINMHPLVYGPYPEKPVLPLWKNRNKGVFQQQNLDYQCTTQGEGVNLELLEQ